MGKGKLYTVSNAHLDTQWNWTIQDVIRDSIPSTMNTNFAHFEKYPEYRFNFEGAFRYKLAKEYYPASYERLKGYVKEGRWNVCGSSWDACDTNVPSSEAFMRQILYGNGWWEKELGVRSTDIFLPDCFGFRYALPSIAAHMGLVGFSTQKLVWGVGMPRYEGNGVASRPLPNGMSSLPQVDLCRWVGPDGNSIIGSFDEGGYTYNYDQDSSDPIDTRAHYLKDIERNETIAGISRRSMYYGAGDYGGGPSDGAARLVDESVKHHGSGLFEVLSSAPDDIFRDLTEEEKKTLPVYRGNLNIPHGYGAMVSHTISKRWNRKTELLADRAERAAVLSMWLGAQEYPTERLNDAWQTLLWHQFHDDVTGTSIGKAYGFSYNDYVIAQNMLASELTASVGAAARSLNTDVPGTPVVVYNAQANARREAVTVTVKSDAAFVRVWRGGEEIPSQCVRDGENVKVTFAPLVDAVSVTVFSLRDSDAPCAVPTSLCVTPATIENARYLVRVDADGNVCSVYDKKGGRELLSAPIHFELMPDTIDCDYPAWEYRYADFSKPFDTVSGGAKVEICDRGAAKVSLKITREYRGTVYETIVSLTEGGERVDFDNHVEWGTRQSMLRVAFPTSADAETALFDQGLGAEENGLSNSYPYFQYSVQQWAHQTDKSGQFGVSVFNDCKYSMDKPDEKTLRLTLIRTPAGDFRSDSLQSWQDFGRNLFRFSFAGDLDGISREAEASNQPFDAFFVDKHPGAVDSLSFASLSSPALVLRCVKKEEKGDRIVVRVQETAGKAIDGAKLTFLAGIASAVETDGYETELGCASTDGASLVFDMKPYQVRTFALTLAAPCGCVAGTKEKVTPLPLSYTKKTATDNEAPGAGEVFDGIAIPSELLPAAILTGGVPFSFAPGAENAMECAGQTLPIPEGTKEVVLLAAAKEDRAYAFQLDGKEISRTVPRFSDRIGTWDQVCTGAECMVRHEELGWRFTHTHSESGDRLYEFANLFLLRFPADGAKTLTLPEGGLLLFAAAAKDTVSAAQATELYDTVPEKEARPTHHLTVKNGIGSGDYPEGKLVPVYVNPTGDLTFLGWDSGETRPYQVVRIGNEDMEVEAKVVLLGHNVAEEAAVTPSRELSWWERAEQLKFPNNGSKWCTPEDENGEFWARFDLPRPETVDSWMVFHAGVRERKDYNTKAYRLQYLDGDEWKDADVVTDNTRDYELREFPAVTSSSFRLWIDEPTQGADRVVRIYQVRIFRADENK